MNIEQLRQQAQDENTAPEILAKLATNEYEEIRQYVASNPNTPTEALLKLGAEFPKELLDNPIFDLLILEDINFVNKIPLLTLNSILRQPNVPEFILEQAGDKADRDIQLALVNKITTSKKVLQKLTNSRYPEVVEEAQLHINITGKIKEKYLDKGQKYIRNKFGSLIQKYARNRIVFELIELVRLSGFPLYFIDIFYSKDRILYGYEKTLLAITNSSATCSRVLDYIAQKNTIKLQEFMDERIPWSTGNMSIYAINGNIARNHSTSSKILNLFLDKNWDWLNKAIASNPKVPRNILTQLAHKEKIKIRDAVAKNINCPIDLLVNLTQDKDKRIAEFASVKLAIEHNCYDYIKNVKITEMVLGNNGNSLRTVDELNLSQEQIIVSRVIKGYSDYLNITPNTLTKIVERYPLCVARNPQTPENLLCKLSQNEKTNVRVAITENPSTPEHILEQLAHDDSPNVIAGVVKNINTPLAIIFKPLVNHSTIVKNILYQTTSNQSKSREVIKSILAKENCNNFDLERILELLIKYGEEKTRIFLAKKKHLPNKTFQQLAETDELMVLISLAENPNTPSKILKQLAFHRNSKIYTTVARNPNTPNNVLEKLAFHNLVYVRQAVANNSNTHRHLLEKLAEDGMKSVILSAVSNSNLTKELSTQPIEEIISTKYGREYLFYNPGYFKNNPHSVPVLLNYYARSQSQIVSYIALLQPQVSPHILEEQSGSLIWLNRFAVAQNKTTSLAILKRLTEDCNQLVRAAAKDRLEKREKANT